MKKKCADIFVDALSQLGIQLVIEETNKAAIRGQVRATQEFGAKLLAKIGFQQELDLYKSNEEKSKPLGHDINDLNFIAEIIQKSGRKLVIEDFHYLSDVERKKFASDLKALWELKLFVVVIGIWPEKNFLIHLNPDLSGRVEEISISWSAEDTKKVISKGCEALNINFNSILIKRFIEDSYQTIGLTQKLVHETLLNSGICRTQPKFKEVSDVSAYESAALSYADQVSGVYTNFANRVSKGIRRRAESTEIYAHALAVIFEASDNDPIRGIGKDSIFEKCHARQSRIQKGNLSQILHKIKELQVDDENRGMILAYSPDKGAYVTDRQVLFYRKYATVYWPWEDIISDCLP